jgi:hypothetical protein
VSLAAHAVRRFARQEVNRVVVENRGRPAHQA